MSGDSRRVELIYKCFGAASGFTMACFGVAVTVAWVTEADLGPVRLILLGSVLEGSVVLGEVPTGVVADTISRKWSIVISYLMVGIGVMMNVSDTFAVLLVAQAVWGIGHTFQSGATTAWVTDELGRDVDDLILAKARWQQVGLIFGIVAGIGIGAASLDVAIATAGTTAIAVSIVLAIVMPETGFSPAAQHERSRWCSMVSTAVDGSRVLRGYRITRLVIVAALIGGFASEVVDRLMVLRLIDVGVPRFEPVVAVGILMLVGRVVVWLVLGRLQSRVDTSSDAMSARFVAVSYAVVSAGVFALALGPVFAVAAAGHVIQATSRQIVEPIEAAIVNRKATAEHRATILSFHGQADAVGQVTGGITMAVVAYLTTVSAAMSVGGVLFLAAGLVVGVGFHRR
ncbi:MAG: MFS transporter [Actinomycetota bacterium]|nr:MFS transporter [Actinomycetota bacterium]